MSCGMCAARVENRLNKIEGVRASVKFATKVATIDAGRDISVAELCDAVRKVGYGAELSSVESEDLDAGRPPGPLRQLIAVAMLLIRWITHRL
ncbi:heavy-metal-associated domain-containing protein [Mycolicibacterium komossense]|uniref:Heavy-metal-associated domain-containing protein n=1 Tax=Mycolicibacterium komossense TaxID=1779 RepID=A0ABT3CG45_9MYCO|nr:heavy-metal-associated domain-containing protein [Mycolicibacterium komossense]